MIEKELIQKFYRISLFGNEPDPVTAAAKRAYRDFCRTIDFEEKTDHSKAVEKVTSVIRTKLKKISEVQSKEGYDRWHSELSNAIKDSFDDASLKVGQVQKWINMTMKYLIILKEDPLYRVLPYLHVPIDSIILKKSGHSDFFAPQSWSLIDDYDEYMHFQNTLREEHEIPIEWEFEAWNDAETQINHPAKTTAKFEKYNYYRGEAKNPFPSDSTDGRFWHGEMMYDQLQNKDYFTQEAKKWRKELEELKPDCKILLYDDVTLGIILYTDCIFGKFYPYGNTNWIFEYETKPRTEKPAFYKRLSAHCKKHYDVHEEHRPHSARFIELMNQVKKSEGATKWMFFTDEEREYLGKEDLVTLGDLHPGDADYYRMCD